MNTYGNRHGDVMLKPIGGEIAERVRAQAGREESQLTIALGEATGHHHTLYPTGGDSRVRLVEIEGRRFLDVGTEYFLRHQEHKEQKIFPGVYEIVIEKEYDPFEKAMRKVVD